ncbi:IclR family transcriptional regulator [Halapricum hydrolyticum]|uniref:IclR family transcriptional regulator n=1 Tax=Halapricum hydrolyticum TaxID=2979991 RepID=A0AAE3IBD3_9EURY|nr:IclR family transcriptional regulator [Halapricum hydrolyticum]MCU4717867.1 IclR family transcriptional regulator [Halapricum hydrolyticum]MCU4727032.1 IclR family transcriptional regulator [Halapricum hydrolyticum]
MARSDGKEIKATRTSFAVLEAVAELDGAGISELARHLDRSKGGIYKHVHTLADLGYLVERDGAYRLSLGLWSLGATVPKRAVPDRVESIVDNLAASVGHVATLVLYESGRTIATYIRRPTSTASQPFREGESLPLHATASGKAVLAFLPDEERNAVFEGELDTYTDATLTDPETVKSTLETIRQQRLARDDGEYRTDIECLAAPILDDSGYPRGAVGVSRSREESGDDELDTDASLLVSASKSIENALTE